MIDLETIYALIIGRENQYKKIGIIIKEKEDEIEFYAPFSRGSIHFWNQYRVIEENIYDLHHRIVYHLTYELESIEQALNLLNEFNDNLLVPRQKRMKIVICSKTKENATEWVKQLQDIAIMFNVEYRFYPLEIYNLKDDAYLYDLVVLLPDVKFLEKVARKYSDQPVLSVNTLSNAKASYLELFHKIQSILS